LAGMRRGAERRALAESWRSHCRAPVEKLTAALRT